LMDQRQGQYVMVHLKTLMVDGIPNGLTDSACIYFKNMV